MYERVGIFHFLKAQNRRYAQDQGAYDSKQSTEEKSQHIPHHSTDSHDAQQPSTSSPNSSDLRPAAEKDVMSAELKNIISALGKQIEHDLQKRLQKEQDDQIWEMWKGWFDEDDREEHVLVLI